MTSASSIISCTGESAAPARNQPANVTRPARSGSPTASASSNLRWARAVSSNVVPTTTTLPVFATGPARSRARSPRGPASRTSVT